MAAGFNLSRPDNACTTVGTNALGVTTVQLFGSGSPGVATVTFTLGSITASRTVTLTGTPAGLVLDGARQTGAGLGYIAKDIVRGSQSGGTAEDELYVVANVNDINGNPVAGPTVIVTLTGRNAANAIQSFWSAGGPENLPGIGGGAYCDVSVGPTCVDLAQAGSGSAGRAAAVGYIDIDAATPSGTYTVTGSCLCGPGGAEITGTYSFKIAQKPSVIVVTGPGALFVGANDSATATITDVDGAVVADGTAILWSSSTAFLLLQTAGGAVATTGLGTTTTNGVITITLIAVGPGVAQVVANYGTLVNNNLRVIVSSASDGSGGALAVTPNSPYVAGLNSIVVQGGGTPAAVAVVIATASGLTVTVIWVFSTGQWVFFLPATPAIAGGLTTFPGPLASAFVGLG